MLEGQRVDVFHTLTCPKDSITAPSKQKETLSDKGWWNQDQKIQATFLLLSFFSSYRKSFP